MNREDRNRRNCGEKRKSGGEERGGKRKDERSAERRREEKGAEGTGVSGEFRAIGKGVPIAVACNKLRPFQIQGGGGASVRYPTVVK